MITIAPDEQGKLVFEQYAYDDDGDHIRTIDVWLKAVDGFAIEPAFRHPSWLVKDVNWSVELTDEPDGKKKCTFHFSIPTNELAIEKVYRIAMSITDDVIGHDPVIGEFTLSAIVESGPKIWYAFDSFGRDIWKYENNAWFELHELDNSHQMLFSFDGAVYAKRGNGDVGIWEIFPTLTRKTTASFYPWGGDIDQARNCIYVATSTTQLHKIDLSTWASTLIRTENSKYFGSVCYDEVTDRIYWLTQSSQLVWVPASDSTAVATVVGSAVNAKDRSFALDTQAGYVWVTEGSGVNSRFVRRRTLSDMMQEITLAEYSNLLAPEEVILDRENQMIYMKGGRIGCPLGSMNDQIIRMDYDGGSQAIVTEGAIEGSGGPQFTSILGVF